MYRAGIGKQFQRIWRYGSRLQVLPSHVTGPSRGMRLRGLTRIRDDVGDSFMLPHQYHPFEMLKTRLWTINISCWEEGAGADVEVCKRGAFRTFYLMKSAQPIIHPVSAPEEGGGRLGEGHKFVDTSYTILML